MTSGKLLKTDADLHNAVQLQLVVEIKMKGITEYEGRLYAYDEGSVTIEDGWHFQRRNTEIWSK